MAEELPPFSLEEAEEWLHKLEDIATIERDIGYACRLVLGNLLVDLQKSGIFNSKAFLERIAGATGAIPEANFRLSTIFVVNDFLEQVNGSSAEPYMPSESIH